MDVMHFSRLLPPSLSLFLLNSQMKNSHCSLIALGRAKGVDNFRPSSPLKLWQWLEAINVCIMSGFLSTRIYTYSSIPGYYIAAREDDLI